MREEREGGRRGREEKEEREELHLHCLAMVLVLVVQGVALVLVVRLGRLHLRLGLRCGWCLGTIGATPHLTSRSCSTTPFFFTTNLRRPFT